MFGDVLRKKAYLLENSSTNKKAGNAFWIILRDIAKEDIIDCHPEEVDSDIAVGVYYDILKENEKYISDYYKTILPSNHQERYRVLNRNLFTSNAFHPDGLANQNGIEAHYVYNEERKGKRIVYKGVKNVYQ